MKARIKTDVTILVVAVTFTGLLLQFPQLYLTDRFWDNVLDFFGFLLVIMGIFLRMVSRGYKRAYSNDGWDLVMDGPYRLTRNPMYLGSFCVGAGFVLIAWPWWALPAYGYLFYIRFKRQVVKEEEHLVHFFGKQFKDYAQRVPRIWPRVKDLMKSNLRETFGLKQAFSTKEKLGLVSWPFLTIFIETLQEQLVFGRIDPVRTAGIFLVAAVSFSVGFWCCYQRSVAVSHG